MPLIRVLGRVLALFCVVAVLCVSWQVGTLRGIEPNRGDEEMDKDTMLRTMQVALREINYPDARSVLELVEALGRRYEKRLVGYDFVRWGSVFVPSLSYVTDIDLFFHGNEPRLVSTMDFEALERFGTELLAGHEYTTSARILLNDEVRFEGKNLSIAREVTAKGADMAMVTGQYEMSDGWRLPMDVVLQRRRRVVSKSQLLGNVRKRLADRNFASVVTRMRYFLPEDRAKSFDSGWSDTGGRIRFLAKQLALLRGMSDWKASRYMKERLRLPAHPAPEAWEALAQEEMQRIALAYLLEQQPLYADALRRLAPDIVSSIQAAGRGISSAI